MSQQRVILGALVAVVLSVCGLAVAAPVLVPLARGPNLYEVTEVRDGNGADTVQVRVDSRVGGHHRSTLWGLDDGGSGEDRSIDQPRPARTEDCADDDCYRVVPGQLRVDHRRGDAAGYTVAWEISGTEYRRLARALPELGDPAAHLSSRSLVVHKVGEGHVVFVANGRDGVLYRDVAGGWHRLGYPQGGEGYYFELPPRLSTDPRPLDLTWYAVGTVVLLVGAAGAVAAVVRGPRRRATVWQVPLVALVAGAVTLVAANYPGVGMFPGIVYAVPVILTTLVLGCAVAVAIARRPGAPAPSGR
ncbi:hypothetical protein [Micromonospora sp. WMMD812]|uniref:hypothetical protein n=1 Tax=Micromonospora sp. WMMD812 TaxID=3015152 RepID=UPI00248D2540|nr:hypothetical protein [Micromonospora sp. WMMD812]WBB70038.1 hypothetical protein O7603_12025 [Micromonospora sp. WMMD812]